MLKEWIVSASALTTAVLLLRLVFRKRISQRLMYALWLPVLLRLLLPVSLYSAPVSVSAAAERIAPAVFATAAPAPALSPGEPPAAARPAVSAAPVTAPSQVPAATPVQEPGLRPSVPAAERQTGAPVTRVFDYWRLARFIWLDGAAVMALWMLGVNLAFRNRLRRTRTLFRAGKTPVYLSAAAVSPCLFGLLRPAVYLTSGAEEARLGQVLLHETMHKRQGDHVWSFLRCLALAVWWWNPLVWLAAVLSRRDAELSCDERVLKALGEEQRLDYGYTLVALAPRKTPGALLCAATISGGGKALKERLERIVKKPKLWMAAAVAAVLLTAVIMGCAFGGRGVAAEEPTADMSDGTRSASFRLDRDGYHEDLSFTVTWKDGRAEPKPRQGQTLLRVKDTNTFVVEHALNLYLLDFERETLEAFLPEDIEGVRWADIQAEQETWDNKARWASAPSMSPDGSLLLYQTDRANGGVRLYDFNTREDRRLTQTCGTAGGVIWNGEVSVVLAGMTQGGYALYEVSMGDGEVRPLTEALNASEWTGTYPWLLCASEEGSFVCLNAGTGQRLTLPLAGRLQRFFLKDSTAAVLALGEEEYILSAYTLGESAARQLLRFPASLSPVVTWTQEGKILLTCSDPATGETKRYELDPAGGPTAPEGNRDDWQAAYRELLEALLGEDYSYAGGDPGPLRAMALADLSGSGAPELILFYHGGGDTYTTYVVTREAGELRCLSRDNPLGLPPCANAVEGSVYYPHQGSIPGFQARPGTTAADEDFSWAFFRYYYTADERGNLLEGFYLLNSGDGVELESWRTWFRFGQDGEGKLLCQALLQQGLEHDLFTEGEPESWWAINGEECTAEEYHAAADAFTAWLEQYRYLPGTWEHSCVIFRQTEDLLGAIDRVLAEWTPLPMAVPMAAPGNEQAMGTAPADLA